MEEYKDLLLVVIPAIMAIFAWYTTGVTQKRKEERASDRAEWKELYEQQAIVIAIKEKQITEFMKQVALLQDEVTALKREVEKLKAGEHNE